LDAVILDGTLEELRPALVGRHLSRVRIAGPHAVVFEITGDRDAWLWLEAGRGIAGLYLLDRAEARHLQELTGGEGAAAGRTRQALLLLRKHVNGARIRALRRIAGERVVVIETGDTLLALRLSGAAPALTLVASGGALATLGEGPPCWPLPEPAPETDYDRIDPAVVARAWRDAGDGSPVRAFLSVAPALGPRLARELDGSEASLEALRERLRAARPTLIAPAAEAEWTDASLAGDGSVSLLPFAPHQAAGVVLHPGSWVASAGLFLRARLRGRRFEEQRRRRLDEARRTVRRLAKLEAHLEGDLRGMAEPAALRRQAEALLAVPAQASPVGDQVTVPDPYLPGETLTLRLDARLSFARNAERLFDKAKRIDRARRQVEERLAEARIEGAAARRSEEGVLLVQDSSAFAPAPSASTERSATAEARGPRRYLTSKGLLLLVGRGAKENHHITFALARPEDVWFHARDVPGAHVILRDDEGRAGADDLREGAEVAGFFSEKKGEGRVDVHVTRRKHIRPGRGGAGRVTIGHADTLRVEPRDPEGRLRRR
jgi:predicted ribosome quality control (RQC) complex YloA/Tae2 family protein